MEKTFIHPETRKQWKIRIVKNCVYTQLDKRQVKETKSEDALWAKNEAEKLMMAQMRKGFVLHNPDAEFGGAVLHKYLNSGHTGFMPIAAWPGQPDFYIARTIGQFEDEVIYSLDFNGNILREYHNGPDRLTYEMAMPAADTLIINEKHQLQKLDLQTGEVQECNEARKSLQFMMDQEGPIVLFYDKPAIVVFDGERNKELYLKEVEPEKTGEPFATYYCEGMLSPKGEMLLYRVKQSGYSLVHLDSGSELFIADSGWQPFFSPDNRFVAIGGRYYSTQTGERTESNPFPFSAKTDASHYEGLRVKAFGQLLIVNGYPQNNLFTVWDYGNKKKLAEVEEPFIVKNSNFIVHDQHLILHTDRGVVSIYRLK